LINVKKNPKCRIIKCKKCKKPTDNRAKNELCIDCWKQFNKGKNAVWFGKKHTEASKGKMSKSRIGNKNSFKNKKPHCIDCQKEIAYGSKRCVKCFHKILSKKFKGQKPPIFQRKKYKGIKMRSGWETAYAKYLDKQGIKWEYEPKAFNLGKTTYRPDFYLPESDTYVEIKGRWLRDSKKKFDLFKKKYYSMNIILLMKKELKSLGVIK
jgi:hypothetical protein